MKLYTINAGYFKLDGGAMHGVVPKSMWQKKNPADENNMCTWAMRCMLIDHGNYKILIDTGMGDKQDEKFFSFYYPHGDEGLEKNLKKYGFNMEDITDVFLTHLHFDHCGGAVKKENGRLVPTFPKAIYWTNEQQWNSAMEPNDRERASFLKENFVPLQECNQLQYAVLNKEQEWVTDIRIEIAEGHTDSMMLPLINYKGANILFCADLIPSAAHISMPWVMAYDMRPLDTLREKGNILEKAAEENWVLFFEHDPQVECCTVEKVHGRIRLKETFLLSEIDERMGLTDIP